VFPVKKLFVCDASDKENPVYIGGVPAAGNNYDMAVKDDRLFLANLSTSIGLMTYELSDPAAPAQICQSKTLAQDVFLFDTLLTVSGHYQGCYIFNIADPDCPEIIAQIDDSSIVLSSCTDGNYLYMTGKIIDSLGVYQLYFWVVDISDISQPTTIALSYLATTGFYYIEMKKRGNIVYAACGSFGLLAIDVSNPYEPYIASRYELVPGDSNTRGIYCSNLTMLGNYLFLAVNPTFVIQVLDISDAASPTLIDYYQFPSNVNYMEIQNEYLYTATCYGMYIHHINMPTIECGDANADGDTNIFDVTFLISYLYMGGAPPYPLESADVNSDSVVNIFDITYLVSYLYMGGPLPDCP
jgi:hypothetical protein